MWDAKFIQLRGLLKQWGLSYEEITHYRLCGPWAQMTVDQYAVTHFFCTVILSAQEALFVIIHHWCPAPYL